MTKGGKRPGAGRPRGNPDEAMRRVSITLNPKALESLDRYAADKHGMNRSAAVEALIEAGTK
jgi:metal-responsive CopG/Arc/MetJ family transcriptional regulator